MEESKKNNGVFAALAVVVVLLFFGSFVWILVSKPNNDTNNSLHLPANKDYNVNNNSGVESPTGIYLEQKEYKLGENIVGAIRNATNYNMVVTGLTVEQFAIEPCKSDLEEKCPQIWKSVKNDLWCACGAKCERANIAVLPHNIKEFDWNQETDKVSLIPDSCQKAEAGKYRVKVSYYEDPQLPRGAVSEQIVKQTIYSSEFTVTNKTADQSLNNNINSNNNDHNGPASNLSNQYKIVGSLPSPGESSFVEKIGNFIFMTDISEGLLVIDANDPKNPKLVNKLKIGNGGAYALAAGNYGYALVSGYASTKMTLVDIENPSALKVIAEIDAKRTVQDMALSGHYAYLAIDGPEVETLSVERETSFPYKAKGLTLKDVLSTSGGHAIGVAAPEGTAQLYTLAVAQGENGLGIYDLSRSDILNLKSNISDIGYVNTVAIGGDYIFAGAGNVVKIIDLKTQKEVGIVDVSGVWNLKVKDNMLYVASGEEGVKIFDISDIAKPKQIAAIDTPGRARDLVVDGDYIYVADDRDDLQIIGKN